MSAVRNDIGWSQPAAVRMTCDGIGTAREDNASVLADVRRKSIAWERATVTKNKGIRLTGPITKNTDMLATRVLSSHMWELSDDTQMWRVHNGKTRTDVTGTKDHAW